MIKINLKETSGEFSNIQRNNSMIDPNPSMNHNDVNKNHFTFTYDWKLSISNNLINKTIFLPFIEETSMIITVFGDEEESQDFIIQLFNNTLPKSDNNENNHYIWPILQTEDNNYMASNNVELKALFVNANKNKIQNDFIFFQTIYPTYII